MGWLDALLARIVALNDAWARPLGDFNHRWLSALFRPIAPLKDLLNGTLAGASAAFRRHRYPDRDAARSVVLDVIEQPTAADIALVGDVVFMLLSAAVRAPPTTARRRARR